MLSNENANSSHSNRSLPEAFSRYATQGHQKLVNVGKCLLRNRQQARLALRGYTYCVDRSNCSSASGVRCVFNIDYATGPVPVATLVRNCPFCNSRGLLTLAVNPKGYGISCCGCLMRFPERFRTWDDAITAWMSRRGTVSSLGGKATAGRCSRRKLRASKRNLRRARERQQLMRIRAKVEKLASLVRIAREVEMADLQKKVAEDREWVRSMEPVFRQHPVLNQMLQLLKGYEERRTTGAGP
jgi:hypothetical protein